MGDRAERHEQWNVLDCGMICFGGSEGKLSFQLFPLLYCLRTLLSVEQVDPMDWFLKTANEESVYRLIAQPSDLSL